VTDFDPYAYSQEQAKAATDHSYFDPYAYSADHAGEPVSAVAADGEAPQKSQKDQMLEELHKGPPLSNALGAVMDSKYNPLNWPQMLADKGADKLASGSLPGEVTNPEAKNPANWQQVEPPSPVAATALHMLPLIVGAKAGYKSLTGPPGASSLVPVAAGEEMAPPFRPTPQAVPTAQAQAAADSAFAAQAQGASAKAPDVSKLTPETQAELARGAKSGQMPNPVALQRIHDAETLPVPMRLMPGQALDDAAMGSAEFNAKGKFPEIANRFDEQNMALKGSLEEIRREAAPSAVGNNTVQNSQALIDKLKGIGDTRDTKITAAYTKAEAINGNKLPMDGVDFLDRVKTATEDPRVSEFLPGSVQRSVIARIENKGGDNMTLDDFLASRKILGNELRKAQTSGDGNAEHAINEVRSALEATKPAPGVAAEAKSAFDQATALAKANFDDLKVNPAYKAAYNDRSVTPTGEASDLNKNFVQKHIIGGTQANLRRLRTMFQGDDEANQTMTAASLNHLAEEAGIDPIRKTGNFSGHGFNSAYGYDIAPRAKELLQDPELIDKVEQLGRAAGYSIDQKRGTSFNNSHTFVASQADTVPGKVATHAVKTIPYVGNIAADYLSNKASEKARTEMLDRILKPGAGLYDH
jgi:hypothetical protein